MFYILNLDILSLNENRDYAYGQGFLANYLHQITKIQISYLIFSALGLCVLFHLSSSLKNKILIYCLLIIFHFEYIFLLST